VRVLSSTTRATRFSASDFAKFIVSLFGSAWARDCVRHRLPGRVPASRNPCGPMCDRFRGLRCGAPFCSGLRGVPRQSPECLKNSTRAKTEVLLPTKEIRMVSSATHPHFPAYLSVGYPKGTHSRNSVDLCDHSEMVNFNLPFHETSSQV
jgi:hypothetical protein